MMAIELMWYDWVGLVGTGMVLLGFFLLQMGRVNGNGLAYQLMNLFGAIGILFSLLGKFNVSVFVMEIAWGLVSIFGIVRAARLRRLAREAGAPR